MAFIATHKHTHTLAHRHITGKCDQSLQIKCNFYLCYSLPIARNKTKTRAAAMAVREKKVVRKLKRKYRKRRKKTLEISSFNGTNGINRNGMLGLLHCCIDECTCEGWRTKTVTDAKKKQTKRKINETLKIFDCINF